MLGAQSGLCTVPCFNGSTNQANVGRQTPSSLRFCASSSLCFSFQIGFRRRHRRRLKSILITLKSTQKSNDHGESDNEYLEAFILLSETTRHYRMLTQGFQDETIWQSSAQLFPFSAQARESRGNLSSIGSEFLRRFQSPTIFLKATCGVDFVLPIIVGEFAVEKLIDSSTEDEKWGCPNQFQFVRDLVEKLGYKVTMVRITERVVNAYFARIVFCKAGENDILSIDARPSDAINVANRCRVPIYVNKRIILTDGIRISFILGRVHDVKSTYDVSLDSAAEGPDVYAEELELVQNLDLAVREERYSDAAIWRDKLMKLRDSRNEQ